MKNINVSWPARADLKTVVIEPVKGVKLRVKDNRSVTTVFTYLVQQYHKRVDSVTGPHKADDWGFHFRTNRNDPNSFSTHARAIAIDLDATEHPNGVPTARTFSQAQIREVHKILAELEGTIRWGGDYTRTPDAMHFEVNVGRRALYKIAKKIRQGKVGPQAKKPAVKKKVAVKKSNAAIAKEVVAGKWGNGDVRVRKLKAAGYSPAAVQAEVTKLVKPKKAPKRKTNAAIAKEVLAGKWGSGDVRIKRLRDAGYSPAAVQSKVNQLLRK